MFRDLLSIIFPEECSGCGSVLRKGEELICLRCRNDLPRSYDYNESNPEIYNKLAGRVPLEFAFSFLRLRKGGITQSILHELKYRDRPGLGELLGGWFGTDLLRESSLDMHNYSLIPVPLHDSKQKKRGYNQSYHFAKGLGEALNMEVRDQDIVRIKKTESQTKKSREDRWENVEGSFLVTKPETVEGKNLIIVDDVLTTGATLESCCQQLLGAGANKLGVLVLAEAK